MAVLAAVVFTPAADRHANSCKLRYRQEYPRTHIFERSASHFPSLLTSSLSICRLHGRINDRDMRGLGKSAMGRCGIASWNIDVEGDATLLSCVKSAFKKEDSGKW